MTLSQTPYVSVVFVNRNDGYGGDLEERIAKFIDYYAHYTRRWPGLFEFVVVDWNPPAERPRLSDAFNWQAVGDVTHVEVPPDVHKQVAGARGRPMLDYFGRNVAIRRSRGEFSLILNQDIFACDSILQLIASRTLSADSFYRADRCDFDFAPCRRVAPEAFEAAATKATFCIHRRHQSDDRPISLKVAPEEVAANGSTPEPGDVIDTGMHLIRCDGAETERRRATWRALQWRWMCWRRKRLQELFPEDRTEKFHRSFCLHTNASGDFLLAPREAFRKINGFLETTEVYMHTDTYAVVQLFAAGYRQTILAQPHRVFHADHDRSARTSFQEAMSWVNHEHVLSAIIRKERSYRLNADNWGLADRDLPTTQGIRKW
jgi:GT2 family glycosyltransferase